MIQQQAVGQRQGFSGNPGKPGTPETSETWGKEGPALGRRMCRKLGMGSLEMESNLGVIYFAWRTAQLSGRGGQLQQGALSPFAGRHAADAKI